MGEDEHSEFIDNSLGNYQKGSGAHTAGGLTEIQSFSPASVRKPLLFVITRENCSGCSLMEGRTFAHPRVAEELQTHWNIGRFDRTGWIAKEFPVVWFPTVIAFSSEQIFLKREEGYLPPYEFLPFLYLARASNMLLNGDYKALAKILAYTAERFSSSGWVPEILYYQGVAGHLSGHPGDMRKYWKILREQYSSSKWAHKVSLEWNLPVNTEL